MFVRHCKSRQTFCSNRIWQGLPVGTGWVAGRKVWSKGSQRFSLEFGAATKRRRWTPNLFRWTPRTHKPCLKRFRLRLRLPRPILQIHRQTHHPHRRFLLPLQPSAPCFLQTCRVRRLRAVFHVFSRAKPQAIVLPMCNGKAPSPAKRAGHALTYMSEKLQVCRRGCA